MPFFYYLITNNNNQNSNLFYYCENNNDTLIVRYYGKAELVQFKMYQGVDFALSKKADSLFEGKQYIKNLNDAIFTYDVLVYQFDAQGNYLNTNSCEGSIGSWCKINWIWSDNGINGIAISNCNKLDLCHINLARNKETYKVW